MMTTTLRASNATFVMHWRCSGGVFDERGLAKRLTELEKLTARDDLWNDQENASRLLQEKTRLEAELQRFASWKQQWEDALTLEQLAGEESDDEALREVAESLLPLHGELMQARFLTMMEGEADHRDCFVEIHAGSGGTEAQDWAEMLLRMYMRWANRRDFACDFIENNAGQEAGIKSATIRIEGEYAYGWLKRESGVHRLVRLSPFDSAMRRHTSFASIKCYPVIDDSIDIVIEDKDLRIDTYRASGAGGQHVNKTDSAVRITHLPTSLVVQCQNDRSQHRNKAAAMTMLKAKLFELELQKRESEKQAGRQAEKDISWGHQIRSYVLHPYRMIKDLRTHCESGNTDAVLGGDIDKFLQASLTAQLES